MRPHSNHSLTRFLLILGLSCLFLPYSSFANLVKQQHLIFVESASSGANKLHLKLLTAGELSLYKYTKSGPAVPFEESYAPDTAYETEWYLLKEDTGQTVQVTKFNYKSVFKLLLTTRPDIIQKLGTKGYRFKDIQLIIQAYNRK